MTWQLRPPQAHLTSDALTAVLLPEQPQAGLEQLQLAGQPRAGRILQLQLTPATPEVPQSPSDLYVRGQDLIASYAQTASRPFAPQVYWRAVPTRALPALAAVEVIVSVQTDLLDSRPRIDARTTLAASEVLRNADTQCEEFIAVGSGSAAPPAEAEAAPACVLYRLTDGDVSYAELILPSDFQALQFDASGDKLQLRYELFGRFLEKGVILRARRRGLFLPRENDIRAAAECYRAFLQSDLPLTT